MISEQTTKRAMAPFLLAVALMQAPAVDANTSVAGTMVPSADVTNSCVIRTTDSINFGNYDPTSGLGPQGSGSVRLNCTKGAVAVATPTATNNKMTGPGGELKYTLYANSGLTAVWGAPGAAYGTINFANTFLAFNQLQGNLSYQQCSDLANGLVFAYTARPPSYGVGAGQTSCWTGYNVNGAYSVSGSLPPTMTPGNSTQALGLKIAGVTLGVPGGAFINKTFYEQPTIYAPTGTVVSGLTYSVPLTMGTAQGISDKSLSATTATTLTYYAQVPPNQDVPSGVYTDTVVLNVDF